MEDLKNLLDYVSKKGYFFGLGVCPDWAFSQMILVKNLWNKVDGRQCRHMVVSFASYEDVTFNEAVCYGAQIASYYANRYQIVYGLHLDTDNIHLHLVMNSVSYRDGKKYSGGLEDYCRFRDHVQGVIPNWNVGYQAAT